MTLIIIMIPILNENNPWWNIIDYVFEIDFKRTDEDKIGPKN